MNVSSFLVNRDYLIFLMEKKAVKAQRRQDCKAFFGATINGIMAESSFFNSNLP